METLKGYLENLYKIIIDRLVSEGVSIDLLEFNGNDTQYVTALNALDLNDKLLRPVVIYPPLVDMSYREIKFNSVFVRLHTAEPSKNIKVVGQEGEFMNIIYAVYIVAPNIHNALTIQKWVIDELSNRKAYSFYNIADNTVNPDAHFYVDDYAIGDTTPSSMEVNTQLRITFNLYDRWVRSDRVEEVYALLDKLNVVLSNIKTSLPCLYYNGNNAYAITNYFSATLATLTISVKCKRDLLVSTGAKLIFSYRSSQTDLVQLFAQSTIGYRLQIRGADGNLYEIIDTALDTTVEREYLVSVNTVSKIAYLYVDKILVGSLNLPLLSTISATQLTIGGLYNGMNYTGYYQGTLYEVTFSNEFISSYSDFFSAEKEVFSLNEGLGSTITSNPNLDELTLFNTFWDKVERPVEIL